MGKKIQNYCLETVIGEGQFGKVYRAINQKTDQTVAIKVIRIDKYRVSPRLEQFTINQIQTLSKIQDTTHIVKFIEILKTANNVYFVYEYCNGGTLETLIRQQGHFSEEKALKYFKDLLKAFKMLVRNNIMHRDIKPSNILLNNGIIKLADFGFCKPLKDARDLSQTMLGSPIYMAPQILKGQLYTINADIWSLGVVLYEMLFGYCPFQERNIARLIDLINSSAELTFPTHIKVSRKIQELLKRMLIKDHFRRISWQQLFEYDLSSSLEPQKFERGKSPFMKKHFNSASQNTQNNSILTTNYSTKTHQQQKNQFFKKTEPLGISNNQTKNSQTVIIKQLIQSRNKLKKGITIIHDLLTNNNSKLTVNICCFIAKKIRQLSTDLDKQVKRIQADKQNHIVGYEMRKALGLITDQVSKLSCKISHFQEQLKYIKEPQDILFMRYIEQEGLTQQKQGLIRLLQIDDYLRSLKNSPNYTKLTKKQLRDQYDNRIIRSE